MKCKNCGAELTEGILFCPECGEKNEISEQMEQHTMQETADLVPETAQAVTLSKEPVASDAQPSANAPVPKKYCPQCGTENEADAVFCGNCGFSFTGNPSADAQANANSAAPAAKAKKPGMKKALAIGAVAAGVVVLGVGAYTVMRSMGVLGKKEASKELLYLKGNEINIMAGKNPITIEGDFWENSYDIGLNTSYNPIQFSDDGNYLFYPQDYTGYEYDLYRKKASSKKDDGIKIDSGVRSYKLISEKKIAYIKNDGAKLYISDTKDKEKVDSDVSWFRISDDKKYILWCTSDHDMYVQDISLKKDKIKLDSDVEYACYFSDDLRTLLYKAEGNLYRIKDFGDEEKIDSDIDNVSVYTDDDKLLLNYTKIGDSDAEYSKGNLVNDDMAASDALMKEPSIEDYQTTVTSEGWFGPIETTETDYDAYYDANEKYQEKLNRDSIREYFDEPMYVECKEFYCYDIKTKKSELVTSLCTDKYAKSSGEIAAIEYYDIENAAKVKLSEVSGAYDLDSKISENLSNSMKTCVIKGTTTIDLDLDAGEYGTLESVYSSKDMLYLTYHDNSDKILLGTDLSKDKGKLKEISDEVSTVEFADEKGIYYIASVGKDGEGELYLNKDSLVDDVKPGTVIPYGKNALIFGTDVSDREKTLVLYKNGKKQTIAEDVADYYILDDERIALLTDYNFSKYRGDLQLYTNGKLKDIDTDVASILRY